MNKSVKFNLTRYKELLTKTESSSKQGKEYFQDPEVLELLDFQSSVETQIFYEQKMEYLKLIQKYLDERISPGEFRNDYLEIATNSMKKARKILLNEEELSMLWIESGLEKFSSLFDEIHEACQCILEFGTDDEGISEDKFRGLVEKMMIKIKLYDSTSE